MSGEMDAQSARRGHPEQEAQLGASLLPTKTPCDTEELVILQLCALLQSQQRACCHDEQAAINASGSTGLSWAASV